MAALPLPYYGTTSSTLRYADWPQPSACRTVYREQFDAFVKRRKREAAAVRTRAILRDVARVQGVQARTLIEQRRVFLRPVGKRLTEAQRTRGRRRAT